MTKTSKQVGQPITYMGYDGKMYDGTLVEALRRGVRISYYVPQVMRECQTCLTTAEAKKRIIVHM